MDHDWHHPCNTVTKACTGCAMLTHSLNSNLNIAASSSWFLVFYSIRLTTCRHCEIPRKCATLLALVSCLTDLKKKFKAIPLLCVQWRNTLLLSGYLTPHRIVICNKLEQVQRRAARFARCKYERTASATSMLNDLKWESLESRRNSQRLTMFYRMQHNMVSTTPADYLVPVQSSRSRRSGHDQMYQVPYARTDASSTPFSPPLYACGIHYQ